MGRGSLELGWELRFDVKVRGRMGSGVQFEFQGSGFSLPCPDLTAFPSPAPSNFPLQSPKIISEEPLDS